MVGSGRRLRLAGAVFDGPEVGGVVTGRPVQLVDGRIADGDDPLEPPRRAPGRPRKD